MYNLFFSYSSFLLALSPLSFHYFPSLLVLRKQYIFFFSVIFPAILFLFTSASLSRNLVFICFSSLSSFLRFFNLSHSSVLSSFFSLSVFLLSFAFTFFFLLVHIPSLSTRAFFSFLFQLHLSLFFSHLVLIFLAVTPTSSFILNFPLIFFSVSFVFFISFSVTFSQCFFFSPFVLSSSAVFLLTSFFLFCFYVFCVSIQHSSARLDPFLLPSFPVLFMSLFFRISLCRSFLCIHLSRLTVLPFSP